MENAPYGPRLSDEEYDRCVVELQRSLPPVPTREQDRAVRRGALDLAIDHRLGRDFPQSRREALWDVSERLERKRLRLGVKYLLGLFIRPLQRRHATALTAALAAEYSKVLTREELEQFLGLREHQRPALPIDAPRHPRV